MSDLNQKELSCLEHQFREYPDGMEFADPWHPWSHDLDLFGEGSLYQYLNRTSTLRGSAMLAGRLTTEPESPEIIFDRQAIIPELKDADRFQAELYGTGSPGGGEGRRPAGISRWLSTPAYIRKNRWLFYTALVVSGIAMIIIVSGFFDPARFWFLLSLLIFNLTLLAPFIARTNRYQSVISKKHNLLEGYASLLKMIAGTTFNHQNSRHRASHEGHEGGKKALKTSRVL